MATVEENLAALQATVANALAEIKTCSDPDRMLKLLEVLDKAQAQIDQQQGPFEIEGRAVT